jgi:hypothetical protein
MLKRKDSGGGNQDMSSSKIDKMGRQSKQELLFQLNEDGLKTGIEFNP